MDQRKDLSDLDERQMIMSRLLGQTCHPLTGFMGSQGSLIGVKVCSSGLIPSCDCHKLLKKFKLTGMETCQKRPLRVPCQHEESWVLWGFIGWSGQVRVLVCRKFSLSFISESARRSGLNWRQTTSASPASGSVSSSTHHLVTSGRQPFVKRDLCFKSVRLSAGL